MNIAPCIRFAMLSFVALSMCGSPALTGDKKSLSPPEAADPESVGRLEYRYDIKS